MKPEDLDGLDLMPKHRISLLSSKAFTGVYKGEKIAIGGVLEQWPGYGRGWFKPLKEVPLKAWVGITGRMKEGIIRQMTLMSLDRLDIHVDAKDEKAIRWAERLGFERECLARKYLPGGGDAYIYVITGVPHE